jgi:hypothetical protein
LGVRFERLPSISLGEWFDVGILDLFRCGGCHTVSFQKRVERLSADGDFVPSPVLPW